MRGLKKLIDLLLYGNFWIALGALSLILQTQYLLTGTIAWTNLAGFVFCATWLLYAIHRIVGILRLKDFLEIERYRVIHRFRSHIIIYAIIAGVGTLWYFFQLSFRMQIITVLPSLFSLGYVLPFFGKQRRLRDFDQIKIYLVAFVWAWVTVILPIAELDWSWNWSYLFLFLERALFIFAITLPFDIRDLQVDGHSSVQTIPAVLGVEKSIHLALIILGFAFTCVLLNGYLGFYSSTTMTAIGLSLMGTAFLIRSSSTERHDYFYSGLMDGTMLLQGGLLLLSMYV